jgi:LysR family transcriptional regulator, hypochlorite-specific transcription factor HypT
METKWLEDFVSLAETRSFSRSAALRHVTQPAFSRRIQSLEQWAGADLVDRSSYPTRLTPAGETLYTQALEMLQGLQSTRAMLRAHSAAGQDMIEFAVPHSLAFTFFPSWVSTLRTRFGPLKSRLIALNVHDAAMRLVEGSCDLLIAFHHPSQPLQLDPDRFESLTLGVETIAPFAQSDDEGRAIFQLPGRAASPLPYLGYAPGAYLGGLVDVILKSVQQPAHLDRVYETDMAEGLKAMALEGHGIAFLPTSAVKKELRAKKLSPAAPGGLGFEAAMDIRILREKPLQRESARDKEQAKTDTPRATKRTAQALWDYLVETTASANAGNAKSKGKS